MKFLIASDIHGSEYFCTKLVDAFHREKADKLLLLGDLLYHGPRNDLPDVYAPKKVIDMLNGLRDKIFCVRGNCDWCSTLPSKEIMTVCGKRIFITHGHLYNAKTGLYNIVSAAREEKADILLFGHTHNALTLYEDGLNIMNPGHCSGYMASYGYIDITDNGDIVMNTVQVK